MFFNIQPLFVQKKNEAFIFTSQTFTWDWDLNLNLNLDLKELGIYALCIRCLLWFAISPEAFF